MQSVLEIIYQSVDEADYVLLGIGEAFKEDGFQEWEEYRLFLNRVKKEGLKEEQTAWMIPYLKAEYSRMESVDVQYQKALDKLETLLAGKNYFVVTLNADDRIYKTRINPERIAAPCGSYRYLQCSGRCRSGNLIPTEISFSKKIREAESLLDIEKPLCQYCQEELVFNLYTEPHYDESGYLNQWKDYQKWTGETLNKKLCMLELGAGFALPSIIRWPFEKITFFNQKARLIRIHDRFPQLPKEILERSLSYSAKPVDLFAN